MKKLLLATALIFTFSFSEVNAQVAVTTYGFQALGVHYQKSSSSKFAAEIKVFANRDLEDVALDAAVFFNFRPREYHRFSVGLGVHLTDSEMFNEYIFIPVQLEVTPFQNFRRLTLVIELAPVTPNYEFYDLGLRHLWGIRYRFGD